ncbi:hypothetical protein PQU96_11990 [Vogesella sp. LYT5W]|uniref:Uncharacterized protein n=1 Tax=Vogesella margarita TaxID=2984199 RepID=A0ABT5IQN5_9NEIS|nr:hypothetical protein [Vogesella margarita]MDC7714838.1 hypothetical protein [Vogesella margarita]
MTGEGSGYSVSRAVAGDTLVGVQDSVLPDSTGGGAVMSNTTEPGLCYLLYLYFIPYWLFRDVSRGDQMLREQNYRYNREQRKYLPGYLLKWAVLCALLLASHYLAKELAAQLPDWEQLLSIWALFSGISFTAGLVLMSNIMVAWSFLTFMH